MKVCPKCQHENAADNAFCEQCGADLSQVAVKTEQAAKTKTATKATGEHRSQATNKAHHGMRWGVIAIIAVVAVVVIGLGVSFYQKQVGKKKQIATITQLVKDDQSNAFAKKLVSDDPSLTITGDTVQPFMTYVRKHPAYLKNMTTDLQASGYTSDHTFTVKTVGHNWLIFPVYKLQVTMMHPEISTNVSNAAIKANGTVLATTKNSHYVYKAGPLFPGHYTFKLAGTSSSATTTTDLISQSDVHQSVSLLAKAAKTGKDSTTDSASADTSSSESPKGNDAKHTGKVYTKLSNSAQTAVSEIQDKDGVDPDDYTFTESQPYSDVYEIKLYDKDSDSNTATYRYDTVHDILAKYDSSTGKFVEVD